MPADSNHTDIGSVYEGRFRIEAILGQGGMSTVYRARQLQMDRMVALKIMRAHSMLDSQARERFSREIKAAGSIDHPNIVRPLASGFGADGSAFVAMELLSGTPLSKMIENMGKLPTERALPILLDIAAGLAAAHAHGIMHRDIKPSNVFIVREPDGAERAKIIDFGLAKAVTQLVEGQAQTATTMAGSPLYMSPEQCEQKHTDARTDIYSFGCLMYEVLRGQPPFNGDSAYMVLHQHLHDAPPQMAEVPEYLQAIALKCLHKKPDQRFASGDELLAALHNRSESLVKGKATGHREKNKSNRFMVTTVRLLLLAAVLAIFALPIAVQNPAARDFIAMELDRAGAYAAEEKILSDAAQKVALSGPMYSLSAPVEKLPLDEQERMLEYIKLRVRAIEALSKSDPLATNSAIFELLYWFDTRYIDARDNRIEPLGNIFTSEALYDDALEQMYRLFPLLNNPAQWNSKLTPLVSVLARRAVVRVYYSDIKRLLQPSLEMLNLSVQMPRASTDETAARDKRCQFLIHYKMALEAKTAGERERQVEQMEQLSTEEHDIRIKAKNGIDLMAQWELDRSLIPLLRGDEASGRKLLDQGFQKCLLARSIIEGYKPDWAIAETYGNLARLNRRDLLKEYTKKYGLSTNLVQI